MSLLQFILPLTFLLIWALTSLFNREAPPLPQRQPRPFGPDGPRPGDRLPAARGGLARPGDVRPGSAPPRWAPTNSPGQGTRRPGFGNDDDIVIIEADPRRPGAGVPPAPRPAATSGRRTVRARAAAAPAAKKPEPAPQRALGGTTLRSEMAASLSKAAELQPLGKTPMPLYVHESLHGVKTSTDPATSPSPAASLASSARAGQITAARLREAILMNEILLPPRAARPFRSGRV